MITSPISTVTGAAATETNAASAKGKTTSDYQTFLKMLTTQIRNQDPLNPMEGSDFAVQLATFSGVEQQVRTNELLTQIKGRDSSELINVAGLIGRTVATSLPRAFDGNPVQLRGQLNPEADSRTLVVKNSAGTIVSKSLIPLSDELFQWDGLDSFGQKLPYGNYSFSIESKKNNALIGNVPAQTFDVIHGIQKDESGVKLMLSGGVKATESDIKELWQ